jgi:hypothetical protein
MSGIVSLVLFVTQELGPWIRAYWNYLLDTLKAIVMWVWSWFADFFRPAWEPLVAKYDELAAYFSMPTTTYMKALWATGNQWLPLTEGFTLFSIYFALMALLIGVRTVKKFIPTLSG